MFYKQYVLEFELHISVVPVNCSVSDPALGRSGLTQTNVPRFNVQQTYEHISERQAYDVETEFLPPRRTIYGAGSDYPRCIAVVVCGWTGPDERLNRRYCGNRYGPDRSGGERGKSFDHERGYESDKHAEYNVIWPVQLWFAGAGQLQGPG